MNEWPCTKCVLPECAARCTHTKANAGCDWHCPLHPACSPMPPPTVCLVCSCFKDDHPITHEFVGPQTIKDSGERVTHTTGAVRDSAAGRGRYDLISPIMMERLAKHLEAGALKYAERNWEKGLPICRMFASLFRHSWQAFQGYTDEDHMAAVVCNAMFIMHTLEMIVRGALPASLDDRPHYGLVPPGEPDIRRPKEVCRLCLHGHPGTACGIRLPSGGVCACPERYTVFCHKCGQVTWPKCGHD